MTRLVRRLSSLTAIALTLGMVGMPAAAQSPSPAAQVSAATDPDAAAIDLFTAYSTMLVSGDVAGLEAFLGDAFQIQRTDGSRATKADYLAALPTLTAFDFSDPVETRAGDTLVLTVVTRAELVVDGQAYRPDPAPMLAVFAWSDAGWQLVAQGNFNLPQ